MIAKQMSSSSEDDVIEEGIWRNPHPFFLDPQLLREYRTFQKSAFDVHTVIKLFILGMTFYLGRTNMTYSLSSGFYFKSNLITLVLAFILYVLFLSGYLIRLLSKDKSGRLLKLSNVLVNIFHDDKLGDVIAILSSYGMGANLYARVQAGMCPTGVTLWESQRCNPSALSSSLPLDHTLYVCLLPLLLQSTVHGISYWSTILCWIITSSFIVSSMIHVTEGLDNYSLVSVLVVLTLIHKNESHARLTFAHHRQTSAARKDRSRLFLLQRQAEHQLQSEKSKHELEIISIKMEDERNLLEKEKAQMVALIGNIAHDLKTPLQSFLFNLESLKAIICVMECQIPNEEAHIALSSLESTCCFMNIAINRSTDFAKVSKNIALVPHMESFNLPHSISVALNVIRHVKNPSEIVVESWPQSMCMDIISDKHWLTENIICLLSNAVKYSNGGVVKIFVEHVQSIKSDNELVKDKEEFKEDTSTTAQARVTDRMEYVKISVEDSGIGVPLPSRCDLFQPFKQVMRLAGGTGLGLYSLSNRIKELNGTKGVSPRNDGKSGSIFWFAIPYRPDPQFVSDQKEAESQGLDQVRPGSLSIDSCPSPSPGTGPGKGLRVLLVDDAASILKVVGKTLLNKKYVVETAQNGFIALNMLIDGYAEGHYDVVLMDFQMPVMDGIEAVSRYREFEKKQSPSSSSGSATPTPTFSPSNDESTVVNTNSIPKRNLLIIGMSANSDNAIIKGALDAGMDAFLPKPFTMSDLQTLMEAKQASIFSSSSFSSSR